MTTEPTPDDGPVPASQADAAPAPDVASALGGLDLGALLGMAQNLQSQMAESQDRLATTVVEGQSGGGAVTIAVTGASEFQRVTIRPDAVDPDDVSMLEDLVLAALRDATAKVAALGAEADPLGGLAGGLGGLGGLFGGT